MDDEDKVSDFHGLGVRSHRFWSFFGVDDFHRKIIKTRFAFALSVVVLTSMSNLFKEIVNFSPYGVAIFDKRLGELTYVNKTFKDWGLLDTRFFNLLRNM
jgi:hypothetical protein